MKCQSGSASAFTDAKQKLTDYITALAYRISSADPLLIALQHT
jgi:hypothetical protein